MWGGGGGGEFLGGGHAKSTRHNGSSWEGNMLKVLGTRSKWNGSSWEGGMLKVLGTTGQGLSGTGVPGRGAC